MRGLKESLLKKPLGASTKIEVGDLIKWTSLTSDDETIIEHQGIVISIYIETLTGRGVRMANILPVKSKTVLQIPCIIIKKLETN